MTPQELKNSILQLAIQGKLVPQDPSEGTSQGLFDMIQKEKEKLIEIGKIKKEKPLPEITEGTIPFVIPDSWMWVYLGNISELNGGYAFKSTNYSDIGVRVIRISDFNEKGFVNTKIVRHPFKEEYMPFILEEKNILLCMTGGTVGKSYFVQNINEKMLVNQRVATIKNKYVIPEYINYLILSPLIQSIIQHSKNSTNDNISMDTIKTFPVPLPPLAEQKRIVAKIEELLPLIDRYEEAYNKLEELNKSFPMDLQKSILQMAIQGRLVPQDPDEGTGEELYKQIQEEKRALVNAGKIKKEKPLPEITYDDILFDIPENWKWVRWGDLSESIQYGYNAPAHESGRIKMVRISDIQDGRVAWSSVPYCDISEQDIQTYLLYENDILFARTGGTVGKSFLVKDVPEDAIYAGYLIRTRYSSHLCPEYMKYFMESQLYWNQLHNGTIATAQPNCNGKTLSKMILPLPPLAEQKRIVAKLKEILPLCEKLV